MTQTDFLKAFADGCSVAMRRLGQRQQWQWVAVGLSGLLIACASPYRAPQHPAPSPQPPSIDISTQPSETLPTTPEPSPSATDNNTRTPQPSIQKRLSVLPNAATLSTVTKAQKKGKLAHAELNEVSGMAFSPTYSNVLWLINDSGNKATFYAIDVAGNNIGSWPTSVKNRDWEALAATRINNASYLVVADIGDNLMLKNQHTIHFFKEPDVALGKPQTLQPSLSLQFSYPDGKHNAEAMAIDGNALYIMSKESVNNGKNAGERQESRVYRLPLLHKSNNGTVVAERIASLQASPQSLESKLIAALSGVDVYQPTGLDFDDTGHFAYVISYRRVMRYQRQSDQTWAEAFSQPGQIIHSHSLPQAESISVASDGSVWITSENHAAPLWALPAPKAHFE